MATSYARNAETADRKAKAFDLRLSGLSYREIGRELGVSHVTAGDYVRQTIEERKSYVALKADELRDIEVARLDVQLVALWPKRDEPATAAVLLRLAERRAKFLGLDAPTKLEHMLDPSAVQSVLGFALSGALSGFAEIRDAVVSLGKVGEVVLELIDGVQGGYVAEFEQRARTELQAPSEAA